jgi:UDP-4-amino-4,6-dideoxy-N-acetyl-beta-L-altrosamine N-acetyltransferase
MFTDIEKDFEKHKKWMNDVLNKENCKYWLISYCGENIGLVHLSEIDYIHKRCTTGYYIGAKEFMGRGAVFLPPVYDYVFNKLKLNKIYGEVLEGNGLILGIHEFHGWRNVGAFKNHVYKNGKYYDVHLLELLGTDWLNFKTKESNQEKKSLSNPYELFE